METDYLRKENAVDIGASVNYDLMHVNLDQAEVFYEESRRDVSLSSDCDLEVFKSKEVLAKNEVCASSENQSVFEKHMSNNGDVQKNIVNFCNTVSVNESVGLNAYVKSENSILDFNENDKSITNILSSSPSLDSFFEKKSVNEMDNENKPMNNVPALENSGDNETGLELADVEGTGSTVLDEKSDENVMEKIHNSSINENSLPLHTDQKFSINSESDSSGSFLSNEESSSNKDSLILKKNELKVPNSSDFITIYSYEKFDKTLDESERGKIISVGMNQGHQSELSHQNAESESSFNRNLGNLNLMEVDNLSNTNEVFGENKLTNNILDPLICLDTSNKEDLEKIADQSKILNDLSCKNESLNKFSLQPSTELCEQKCVAEIERLQEKVDSNHKTAEGVDVINHTVQESGVSFSENDKFIGNSVEDNEVQDFLNTVNSTALVRNRCENVKNSSSEFEETKVIQASAVIPPLSFLAEKVLNNNLSDNEKYSHEVKEEDVLCNEEQHLEGFNDVVNDSEGKASSDVKNKKVPLEKTNIALMSRKRRKKSSCRAKSQTLRKSKTPSINSKIAQKSAVNKKGERVFERKGVITQRRTRRSTFVENPYKGNNYGLKKEKINVLPKSSRSSRSLIESVSVVSNQRRSEKKRTNDEAFQRPVTRSSALNPFFHEPPSKCKKLSSNDLKINSMKRSKKTMVLRGDLVIQPEKFPRRKVTVEPVRNAENQKNIKSPQNSYIKNNKIEKTHCMKNLRKSARLKPEPIFKVFVDMCTEEGDRNMFINENNLSNDKEVFKNPYHKTPFKGKQFSSGSPKGLRNKRNQNVNSQSAEKLRDCFVRIERMPLIDKLIPAERLSSSFDVKICELCEPKRAFLSKTALIDHLNESHFSSSCKTVGKTVSADCDIQSDVSLREKSLKLREGSVQKTEKRVKWEDEESTPNLLTREKNSENSKTSSKKDVTGYRTGNLKYSPKHYCEICNRRFLSGAGLKSHKKIHELLPKAECSVPVKEVDPLSIEPYDTKQEFDSEFSVHTKTNVENGNIIMRFRREKSPRK